MYLYSLISNILNDSLLIFTSTIFNLPKIEVERITLI